MDLVYPSQEGDGVKMDDKPGGERMEKFSRRYPFHAACKCGDTAALDRLLEETKTQSHNARRLALSEEDAHSNWTPAHWAAYFGKLECLGKAFPQTPGERGFNSDIRTRRFQLTCLHLAAYGGHVDCLRWLLHSGACPHAKDYLGETAVHKAGRSNSIQCLSLLSAAGVPLSERNNAGMKAWELAEACGNPACASYLRRAESLQEEGRFPPFKPSPDLGGETEENSLSFSVSASVQSEGREAVFGAYGFQPLAPAPVPVPASPFKPLPGRKRGLGECGTAYGKRFCSNDIQGIGNGFMEDQMMVD